MSKEKRLKKAEWQILVNKYDNEKKVRSKASFCREHELPNKTFYRYHKSLSKKRQNFIKLPSRNFKPKHFWVKLFGFKILRLELDV